MTVRGEAPLVEVEEEEEAERVADVERVPVRVPVEAAEELACVTVADGAPE